MAESLLGQQIAEVSPLHGGGNNKLYRVVTGSGARYALKQYYERAGDQINRAAIEYNALSFLSGQGVKCVPEPIAKNEVEHFALYEYIMGQPIELDSISNADLDGIFAFIRELRRVSEVNGADSLSDASEACFTFDDMRDGIQRRLRVFEEIDNAAPDIRQLRAFLTNDFQRVFNKVLDVREKSGTHRQTAGDKILSPSDFGLHNAIRRKTGEIVFLDFEYFGWDLFEKMIADLFLHPGMGLSGELQQALLVQLSQQCRLGWDTVRDRLQWVYPMSALKWCLIILNEFNPQRMCQRVAAARNAFDPVQRRQRQMKYARTLLAGLEVQGCGFSCSVQ